MEIQKSFVKTTLALSASITTAVLTNFAYSAEDTPAVTHLEDRLESIVITAPFRGSEAETALPVGILSGEALREKVTNSLGDTLKNEIGVNNASFGTGVGQPIIRGQTGNRVQILQNSLGAIDAASVSPDHANGVEALLADRIEVVRGPATLLYGSGAIGGVVNVIDNRIPTVLVEETNFQIEQSHNTVNDENKTVFRLDASSGSFGFHLDGFKRKNDNVEIKGLAVDEFALEELEEHMEEAIEALHDEHDEEEFENTRGYIGNSDAEASGGTAGLSYVTDRGFIGFSVSELDNEYGLPLGVHTHAHHEEEHEDEHEGQEEEVKFVRMDLEQTRYDLKSALNFTSGWIESLTADIQQTDYQHGEVEYFEGGGKEVGTLYENEGTNSRFTLNHAPMGNWTGVWGLQLSDSEFSATGEEAFIAKTDINSLGFFGLERFSQNNYTLEIGVRFENNELDSGRGCDFDDSATSLSGSILYDVDDQSNILVGATRSERAPSVEELYSNVSNTSCANHADDHDYVLHAATNLLELGNPNLDIETSNNFEFGYRRNAGRVTGEVSVYYNEIDDYIFLGLTGEQVDEMNVAAYYQKDATFKGLEAQVSFDIFESANSNAVLSFFGDMVDADFDRGGNAPRIPAQKIGSELRFFGDNWSAHVHVTRVAEQDDVSRFELATDGYTLLSLYADYHIGVGGDSEVKLFVRGDNLLDEEIRNHASMLKNFAPESGRGVTLGLRFEY